MSLNFDILTNVKELEISLRQFGDKVIVSSTRRALNRTVIKVRKESAKVIKLNYAGLKAGEIKSVFIRMRKAFGSDLNKLGAVVSFPDKPVSMIRMVVGSKSPRKQKGIKVGNRTPIKVQIQKGKKFVLKRAFIARTSGGDSETTHVFKNIGGKMIKQSLPSVGLMLNKTGELIKLGEAGRKFFVKTIDADLRFRLKRMAARLERKALK